MTKIINALDCVGVARATGRSDNFARARFRDGTIPVEVRVNGEKPCVTAETLARIAPQLERAAAKAKR